MILGIFCGQMNLQVVVSKRRIQSFLQTCRVLYGPLVIERSGFPIKSVAGMSLAEPSSHPDLYTMKLFPGIGFEGSGRRNV